MGIQSRDKQFPIGHKVRFSPTEMKVDFVDRSYNIGQQRWVQAFCVIRFISERGRQVERYLFPASEEGERQTIKVLEDIFGAERVADLHDPKVSLMMWMREHLRDMPCPEKVIAQHQVYRDRSEWKAIWFQPAAQEEHHDVELDETIQGTDEGEGREIHTGGEEVAKECREDDPQAEEEAEVSKPIHVPETSDIDVLEDFFDKQLEERGITPAWKKRRGESMIPNMPNYEDRNEGRHENLHIPEPAIRVDHIDAWGIARSGARWGSTKPLPIHNPYPMLPPDEVFAKPAYYQDDL